MTDFILTKMSILRRPAKIATAGASPWEEAAMQVVADQACFLTVHKGRKRRLGECYSFNRSEVADEIDNLTDFINQHREPTDHPAEAILATTGIAAMIFHEAIKETR